MLQTAAKQQSQGMDTDDAKVGIKRTLFSGTSPQRMKLKLGAGRSSDDSGGSVDVQSLKGIMKEMMQETMKETIKETMKETVPQMIKDTMGR